MQQLPGEACSFWHITDNTYLMLRCWVLLPCVQDCLRSWTSEQSLIQSLPHIRQQLLDLLPSFGKFEVGPFPVFFEIPVQVFVFFSFQRLYQQITCISY